MSWGSGTATPPEMAFRPRSPPLRADHPPSLSPSLGSSIFWPLFAPVESLLERQDSASTPRTPTSHLRPGMPTWRGVWSLFLALSFARLVLGSPPAHLAAANARRGSTVRPFAHPSLAPLHRGLPLAEPSVVFFFSRCWPARGVGHIRPLVHVVLD